jgi:hypothetical protein
MKPGRRDPRPRRVTPDLIAFYTKRAHELRAEYYRSMWRAIWDWLINIRGAVLGWVERSDPILRTHLNQTPPSSRTAALTEDRSLGPLLHARVVLVLLVERLVGGTDVAQ